MTGPQAQIVALTCYGNAHLRGLGPPPFFPDHSTCQYCDRVTFVTVEKSRSGEHKEKPMAEDPDAWFALLANVKARALRLWHSPQNDPNLSDRIAAAFVGGGGVWSIEVLLPGERSSFWVPRWDVWNREAPENRIWRVTYGRVSAGQTCKAPAVTLAEASANLRQRLEEIHAFSQHQEVDAFTGCFAKAIDILDSKGARVHSYLRGLVPKGAAPKEARVLLNACQQAWVFGGMGSWNDLGFDGEAQQRYEDVSDGLYEAINIAIAAAANASIGDPVD